MSSIIKGMEMPKEKSLWLCIKSDGTVYNIKPGGIGTAHTVGTVLPLPEKHGRLVDANIVAETLMKCAKDPQQDTDVKWFFLLAAKILENCEAIVEAEGEE